MSKNDGTAEVPSKTVVDVNSVVKSVPLLLAVNVQFIMFRPVIGQALTAKCQILMLSGHLICKKPIVLFPAVNHASLL